MYMELKQYTKGTPARFQKISGEPPRKRLTSSRMQGHLPQWECGCSSPGMAPSSSPPRCAWTSRRARAGELVGLAGQRKQRRDHAERHHTVEALQIGHELPGPVHSRTPKADHHSGLRSPI